MALLNGFRRFIRQHDGLLIHLSLSDWPTDVPLPEGTRLVETGEGPFEPYCLYLLEPNRTVEIVVGWFIIPPILEQALEWYRREMPKCGWSEINEEGVYEMPTSAVLHFQKPETNLRTIISVRTRPHAGETDMMIRRGGSQPWKPTDMTLEDEIHAREEMLAESMAGGEK